jgi:hypothetical protein
MKKGIGIYGIIWAICLGLFNLIIFITPSELGGISKFTTTFWVSYAFVMTAFVAQLACAFITLKDDEKLKKLFYKIPLLTLSYSGLIVMLVTCSIFMAIPVIPSWIAIIVCAIILAINVIAVIKATVAAKIISNVDDKVKEKTLFIKSLTVDAECLISAADDAARADAKRVYEAIRYSDPMSSDALSGIEAEIEKQFAAFSAAVKSKDAESARVAADELLLTIERRNKKCILLK